jgi:methanogenic corrinoid protein MtbC1
METITLKTSRLINASINNLAQTVTEKQYELDPSLASRYGPEGRNKCLKDAAYHLTYLAEAISMNSPGLFCDYVGWAKVMLAARNIPAHDLAANLQCLIDALSHDLPAEESALAASYVKAGLDALPSLPAEVSAFIADHSPLDALASRYLRLLLNGERRAAASLILDAVDSGTSIRDIYIEVFQKSQYEMGRLWQMNLVSVAQEHFVTAATQLIISQLYPRIFTGQTNGKKIVATCVTGDLHEIGVRMVADFFEMEGWTTFYLGASTPSSSVISAIEERGAEMLAVSATITFHVSAVEELIRAVRASSSCKDVKILVGGYPFNLSEGLWQKVGADGYGRDAHQSLAVASTLMAN